MTAGSSADTAVTNTQAGPITAPGIQLTKTAGGSTIAFITGRVPAGGFTLTDVTTVSLWGEESNMNANAGYAIRVYRYQPGGTLTLLGTFADDVEIGTANAELTWAAPVTDQAFSENDRILVRLYIDDAPALTMGNNFTVTFTFNGASATTGDSFLTIAETVAFKAEDLRPTPAAEAITVADAAQIIMPERRAQVSWIELEVPEAESAVLTLTPTQDITVAEAVTPSLVLPGLTLEQVVTLTETAILDLPLPLTGAQDVTVAETATVANALLPVLASQDVTVAELASVTLIGLADLSLTAEQDVTVAEAASLSVAIPGLVLSEALTVTEMATLDVEVRLTAEQAVTVAETATIAMALPLEASQGVTVAEAAVLQVSAPPQFARPSADAWQDNWEEDDGVTTDIWDQIDEATADDNDYIRTGLLPTNDVYVTKLTSLLEPTVNTGHILRYRFRKDAASGAPIDLTVQLRQGYVSESEMGTLIEQWAETDIVGSGWTTQERTVNPTNVDTISDYTDLYVRVIANAA